MTFKELLEQLQALSKNELNGQAYVYDARNSLSWPVNSVYSKKIPSSVYFSVPGDYDRYLTHKDQI